MFALNGVHVPLACDENALLRFALGLLSEHEAAALRRHVVLCPSCSAYLSTLGTPELDVSVDDGAAVVEDLLARPPATWPQHFATHVDQFATTSVVQSLIETCESLFDRDGDRAETLSSILVASADALASDGRSDALRALAWTRRATALLRVGRLPDALDAVSEAEARAHRIPAADYEFALIAFTAADILRELGRTDEALATIRRAAEIFRQYNDVRRLSSAREMEGAVLFRCGEYASATRIFLSLLESLADSEILACGRLAANAAHCLAKTGEHIRALPLFRKAEGIFTALGYPGYVCRISWGKARSTRASGDTLAAIAQLRAVFEQFAELESTAEWIRVGIELVEWMLDGDHSAAEVQTICSSVYEEAVKAGMQMQMLDALRYLRESAVREDLTVPSILLVREFLETLPRTPNAEFHPPQ